MGDVLVCVQFIFKSKGGKLIKNLQISVCQSLSKTQLKLLLHA